MKNLILIFLGMLLCGCTGLQAADNSSPQSALPESLSSSAPILQTDHSTFWNSPYQNRLADRVFMGAAVANDGNSTFPNLDWFNQLYSMSYNGGYGINSDGNFAQVYILYDSSNPNASQPYPQPALAVAVESINSPTNGTPRGLDFTAVNNSTAGNHPTVWGAYGEAHRVTPDAGQVYVVELDARNSSSSVTGWTPSSFPGYGTLGLDIGCGAGLPSSGQYPCTVGLMIDANPEPWGAGIIFADGGVGAFGPGGSYPAIMMPNNYSIQWWNGTDEASINSDTSGNIDITTYGGGGLVLNGTLMQNSDQRLKTDIKSLPENDLSSLLRLVPVTYNWKDPKQGVQRQTGFIAQDVQKVFPDLVTRTEPTKLTPDGTLTVNYIGLIPHLVQSIESMNSELKRKDAKIEDLERRIERLERQRTAPSQ